MEGDVHESNDETADTPLDSGRCRFFLFRLERVLCARFMRNGMPVARIRHRCVCCNP